MSGSVEQISWRCGREGSSMPTSAGSETADRIRAFEASRPSDARERRLLLACGWDAFTSEDVVQRSGLTVQEVSSMLLKLELAGIIQVQGTGSYLRIR